MRLVSYVLDHILDHVPDYMLDQIIIGFAITLLRLLYFLP